MRVKFRHLIEKLEQIREFLDDLREAGRRIDQITRIIEEIDELIQVLSSEDEDELKAFRLLRMFLEKMRDLDLPVPLLTQFLELYVAALKTTEVFIDDVLKDLGFIGRFCGFYVQARDRIEQQLNNRDDLTEEQKNAEAHRLALEAIGQKEDWKYAEQIRRQFDLIRRKREVERERRDAEFDRNYFGPPTQPTPGLPPSLPTTPPPSPPLTLEEFIIWMLGSLRERLSPEEWERLLERLREMFPPLPPD